MSEIPKLVLIPGHDHNYDQVPLTYKKVTWNPAACMYFEYVGDEHLEEGEVVVEAWVAE